MSDPDALMFIYGGLNRYFLTLFFVSEKVPLIFMQMKVKA